MADPIMAGSALPTSAKDALAQGAPRYFTGRPCKHGHVAERTARTGNCVACIPAKAKLERQRHPERGQERRRRLHAVELRRPDDGDPVPSSAMEALRAGLLHYRTGRPCSRGHVGRRFTRTGNCVECHASVHSPRWRCDNPEAYREQQRRWVAANPEKVAARNRRKWLRDGAERQRKRRAANPELARVHNAKRRAMVKAAGSYTAEQLREVLRLQRTRCAYCRRSLRGAKYHADHIVPIAAGGRNVIANIQALCPHCNVSKGARDPLVFARSRGFLL